MKYENKHLIIAFIVAIALTLFFVWIMGFVATSVSGADLEPVECPICPPCQITASNIRQNAVDYTGERFKTAIKFKLPDNENLEIQIGKDVYTKAQLDTIKLDAIK